MSALLESTAADRGAPVRAADYPVRVVARAMVAVQILVVTWACMRGWFNEDDFAIRAQGAAAPWFDPQLLLQNWGGHFMPGGFVIAQVLGKTAGFGYLAYALTLAAGQALVAILLLRMLFRHFGARWRILLPLAVYLTSIPVLQATVWWASALNALPFLACLVIAADRTLRHVRVPSARHEIWIVATSVAALAFFEKAVLLPVFVVMLLLATTPGDGGGLSPSTVLRRYRRLILSFGAVYAGWYVAYRASGPGVARAPSFDVLPDQLQTGLSGTFVPSLVGGPWAWAEAGTAYSVVPVPQSIGLLLTGVLIAVAFVVWSWGPRARGALAIVAVHALGLLVLLSVGRSVFLLVTTALPRYYADLSLVTAIATAVGLARLVGDPAPAMLREWTPSLDRRKALAVLVGVQAVLLSWALAATSLAQQLPNDRAKSWTTAAVQSFAAQQTAAPVLDGSVPADVMTPLLQPQTQYRWFFSGIPGAPSFGTSTDELRTFADDGRLVPAHVDGPSSLPGPAPNCGRVVTSAGAFVPMASQIIDFGHTMRISYLAAESTDLEVQMGTGPTVTVPVRKGFADVYLSFVGGGTSVSLRATSPGVVVCVSDVTIGSVAPGPAPARAP